MHDKTQIDDWFAGRAWRVLDASGEPLDGDAWLPFAAEELECGRVAAGAPPLLHLWRHKRALVLGLRDRRLPRAAEAMEAFRAEGVSVMVRNSGGAAVPLDAGVLNVTMVVPVPGAVGIRRAFAAMAEWVRLAVSRLDSRLRVMIGEVSGAYCPGDFDLSVNGRKFCGIAQRRKLGACAVQAFIVAEGEGAALAERAARFYRMAAGEETGAAALTVLPASTRSLAEWSDRVTAAGLAEAFRTLLAERAPVREIQLGYGGYDRTELDALIQRMKARYDTD